VTAVRVVLPGHLRNLAGVGSEIEVVVAEPPTLATVLDAVEASYPVLRGTIRDQVTQRRRAFVRYFACNQDLSHEPPDTPLPDEVCTRREPFMIVGAMAGG
jgi:molybdopterin synthase sulfur carrier subunit